MRNLTEKEKREFFPTYIPVFFEKTPPWFTKRPPSYWTWWGVHIYLPVKEPNEENDI